MKLFYLFYSVFQMILISKILFNRTCLISYSLYSVIFWNSHVESTYFGKVGEWLTWVSVWGDVGLCEHKTDNFHTWPIRVWFNTVGTWGSFRVCLYFNSLLFAGWILEVQEEFSNTILIAILWSTDDSEINPPYLCHAWSVRIFTSL